MASTSSSGVAASAATRERGQLIALDQEWDRRLAIMIRPGGTLVMPAQGRDERGQDRGREPRQGQAPRGHFEPSPISRMMCEAPENLSVTQRT